LINIIGAIVICVFIIRYIITKNKIAMEKIYFIDDIKGFIQNFQLYLCYDVDKILDYSKDSIVRNKEFKKNINCLINKLNNNQIENFDYEWKICLKESIDKIEMPNILKETIYSFGGILVSYDDDLKLKMINKITLELDELTKKKEKEQKESVLFSSKIGAIICVLILILSL